ncbi:YjfI family protein [Citrobacter braakii]|uniref:YjfI family protein n=1 Tax=Citrobacter braakii TaxID=57706 RepID=UPI00351CEC5E
MAWTPQLLAEALKILPDLNIDIEYNEQLLIVKMNDYGDLSLSVLFTSRQIIIETVICSVSSIHDQDEFNIFLLRNQKILPLSSVGISRVQHEEYYVAFGALSLNSSLDDVVLEMTTLADNALDLAEITEEYTYE